MKNRRGFVRVHIIRAISRYFPIEATKSRRSTLRAATNLVRSNRSIARRLVSQLENYSRTQSLLRSRSVTPFESVRNRATSDLIAETFSVHRITASIDQLSLFCIKSLFNNSLIKKFLEFWSLLSFFYFRFSASHNSASFTLSLCAPTLHFDKQFGTPTAAAFHVDVSASRTVTRGTILRNRHGDRSRTRHCI